MSKEFLFLKEYLIKYRDVRNLENVGVLREWILIIWYFFKKVIVRVVLKYRFDYVMFMCINFF